MTYTYLQNATIDGGSAIDLQARNITFGMNTYSPIPSIPGKNLGSSYDSRLHEADFLGFDNPQYIVNGIIQLDRTTNQEGSVAITIPRLGSFMMCGSDSVFVDDGLIMNHAGSAMVVCTNLKCTRNPTSDAGRADMGNTVYFDLTLKETKKL